MKPLRIFFLLAALVAVSEPPHADSAPCNCSGGVCPVPASSPVFVPVKVERDPPCGKTRCDCGCKEDDPCRCATWKQLDDSPEYALLRGGKQIGSCNVATGVYRPYTDGVWGEKTTPPIPFPREVVTSDVFGVDSDKLGGRDRCTINGKPCSKREALQAIEAGIPDESGKIRLTVIGPDAARKQVVADIANHPSLAGEKGKCLVQSYEPTHWAVARAGFKTDGSPTIYLQKADGTVLHRQDKYEGPEKLAEAIRKADPLYKPEKDPNLLDRLGLGMSWPKSLPSPLVCGLIAVGLWFILKKRS